MRFDQVVERIRCPGCLGDGTTHRTESSDRVCQQCNGSGINPEVIDEASGWGTWAISVHDRPGWLVVVNLGLDNPTVSLEKANPAASTPAPKIRESGVS